MPEPGPNLKFDEQRDRNFSPPCIIGFGRDGVIVSSPESAWPGPMKTSIVVFDMAYDAGGWRINEHPRMLADTTGNGHKDIVGFGHGGVFVAKNTGNNTFEKSRLVLNDFGYASGWRQDKHIRLLADLRGTGRADIVGFGDTDVFVSLNCGDGIYAPLKVASKVFTVANTWAVDKHPRFLADVTGNGQLDIVGFGDGQTYITRSNGDGTFGDVQSMPNLEAFGYNYGWRVATHPRHLVDLTGDGRADVLGFKNDGVLISLNDGQGKFAPMSFAVHGFGTCQGWEVDKHPRFVLPLTNQKAADIIGFGDAGVYVSMNKGDGTFEKPKLALPNFGYQQGWRTDRHPRFLVDLTGDGCPDIIGFFEHAIWMSLNTGQGTFGPPQELSEGEGFTAINGWTCDKTIRFVSAL